MKTLIIYELVPDETKVFLVDGDKSYLHGKFVNTTEDIPEPAYTELCETPWGEPVMCSTSADKPFKIDAETIVVVCGFIC